MLTVKGVKAIVVAWDDRISGEQSIRIDHVDELPCFMLPFLRRKVKDGGYETIVVQVGTETMHIIPVDQKSA